MEGTWWTNPEQLDEDQTEVVALGLGSDFLVLGPPGSGKTNLLILRASYIHGAGQKNIAILTFGRVLREFIAAGSSNYTFDADKVQTYSRWASTVIRDNGSKLEGEGDFASKRHEILDKLKQVAAKNDEDNVLDCILLDEAQDYSSEEIDTIRRFARNIFAVGDNRQRVYDVNGGLEALSKFCAVKTLRYHYRNGVKICRVIDGIRNELDQPAGFEAWSNYDEKLFPSTVEAFSGLTIEQQVAKATPLIQTQLVAYPEGVIGVLCPRNAELAKIWSLLADYGLQDQALRQQHEEGYVPFDPERRIILATVSGAKGLEFRTVHLLGISKVTRFPLQKNITYTGVSRAKTSLAIYAEQHLPGYLERGLAALKPPPAPPSLGSLFKV